MQYRKEIDGLRAIAVVPVIFFHGGLYDISGGYVGVDIFFVISGYLITTIILDELEQDRFSILKFYERRVRRILPALSVVLLFTTIAAFVLLPGQYLKSYSQSLVSVTTFLSNVYFYLTSGYFSAESDEKPLLHTWSLAVEEQYYLFFPLMLSVFWIIGRNRLALTIAAISLASLVLSQYLAVKQEVDANFYLIFSRAWELFAGSLIAFWGVHELSISRWKREVLSGLGMLLLAYSIFFFDNQTPFPSIYAAVPVIGAGLIIAVSDGNTYVGRLLSNKIMVGIGLISYSLYLWHQPLFSILRLKMVGEPSHAMFLGAVVLTFVLSFFSYKYVEKPFRNRTKISKKTAFLFGGASLSFFLAIGLSGHFYQGFEGRFANDDYVATIKYSPKRKECHTSGKDFMQPEDACRYFGQDVTWATFGDSHVVELSYALAKQLEPEGKGLVQLSFSGCPPALDFDVKLPGCSKWIHEALAYLENNASIENVLLGFRYSAFLYGGQLDAYPEVPDEDPTRYFTDESKARLAADAREVYWQSLSEIVHRLVASGKKVYMLYPVPELPVEIAKAVTPFSVFDSGSMIDLNKSTSSKYYFSRNRFIIDKLNSLPYGDNLYQIDPFDIMCHSQYCPAVAGGKALYFDDHHLSVAGADMVISNSVISADIALESRISRATKHDGNAL